MLNFVNAPPDERSICVIDLIPERLEFKANLLMAERVHGVNAACS